MTDDFEPTFFRATAPTSSIAMTERPADAAAVDDALRLGWAIAALRGRYTEGIAK